MPASVTVAVRIRPLNEHELTAREPCRAWQRVRNTVERIAVSKECNISPQTFPFDTVFDETATNVDVYRRLAEPLVTGLFNGRDSTIMAYGQTCSGKTHTMFGAVNDAGLAQCAIEQIIDTAQQFPQREFDIRASYVEVYNERVRDLLRAGSPELKVRDCADGNLAVDALQEKVCSYADAMRVLRIGKKRRVAGVTTMNAQSSRSHALLSLQVSSTGNDDVLGTATLHFVDLAGSERAAVGGRAAEGNHINRSLLALGRIVSRLANGKTANYLPYRDSKLTRLLRPAFSSGGHITLLGAITPASAFADETLSTLKFASCLKNIRLVAPQRNTPIDYRAEYMRVSREMDDLRDRLVAMEQELVAVRAAKFLATPNSPSSSQSVVSASSITSTSLHSASATSLVPKADEVGLHIGGDNEKQLDDHQNTDCHDDIGIDSDESDSDDMNDENFNNISEMKCAALQEKLQLAEARAARAIKENVRLRQHLRTVVAELRGFRSIRNSMTTSRFDNYTSFDSASEGYSEIEMSHCETRRSVRTISSDDSERYLRESGNTLASSATVGRVGVIRRVQPDINEPSIAFGMSGASTNGQRYARSKFELAVRLGNNDSALRFYGTSSEVLACAQEGDILLLYH